MSTTKNLRWALAIATIAILMIAIMANCVSAPWSYAKEEGDPTIKEYFEKIKKGFEEVNEMANLKFSMTE